MARKRKAGLPMTETEIEIEAQAKAYVQEQLAFYRAHGIDFSKNAAPISITDENRPILVNLLKEYARLFGDKGFNVVMARACEGCDIAREAVVQILCERAGKRP